MSRREQVLSALFTVLSSLASPTRVVLRGGVAPEKVPPGGLIILRDGDPGESNHTLSPMTWHYEHRAELELIVQDDPASRDAAFDALAGAVGTVIAADRRLGGLCDWAEAEAPETTDLPFPGAQPLKAAVVPVMLHYSTTDPLN